MRNLRRPIGICLFVLLLCAAGCYRVDVNYIGKTYPPTKNVELYFDKNDVPEGYQVIGRAIVTVPEGTPGHGVKKGLVKEAEAKGADALLVGQAKQVVKDKVTTWDWNYYGGPGSAWGDIWGWGYGDPEWDVLGPEMAFQAPHASDERTVYQYAMKIKVLFLKKPT
jgi:hypothetical protein